jgi:NAD-dependent dihydropyrimidine dehydrogenase PreA subunit
MNHKSKHFIIKSSTLKFYQEGRRTPGYTFFDWIHGYIYGRWPYLYIGIGTGEHYLSRFVSPLIKIIARLFATQTATDSSVEGLINHSGDGLRQITFADTYHGKVVPLESATQLVSIHQEIKIADLEKVIPYAKARDIVLKNPDHIVVLECPCRSARANPCLPLDVCLVIGDPFASFVEEHHPRRARRITSEEAREILHAENQRGHVHHAFFKDAMLGRFYAICNCCACCCGAMQAHQRGTPMLASSGYLSKVDRELCIGCGDCTETCQFGALSIQNCLVVVDEQACMGCGVCVSKCAQGALTLELEPSKGVPLEIYKLIQEAGQYPISS